MGVVAFACCCSVWAAEEPLRYSVEDVTAKYKYSIAMTRVVGDKYAEESRTAWFTWRQKGDGERATVTLTVDRASMKNEGMYGYDKHWSHHAYGADSTDRKAANSSVNTMAAFSAAKYLVGKTLRFRLSPSGGVDEIIPAPALNVKLDTKDKKRAQLWAGLVLFDVLLGSDAKEQSVTSLLPQFPANAVKVGARWTGEQRSFGRHGVADRTFVLRERGAAAVLDLDFKFSADAESKADGVEWETESSNGSAEFDPERGILKRSSLTFKYKRRLGNREWMTTNIEAGLVLVK